jgi:hypothetical protein
MAQGDKTSPMILDLIKTTKGRSSPISEDQLAVDIKNLCIFCVPTYESISFYTYSNNQCPMQICVDILLDNFVSHPPSHQRLNKF